MNDQPEQPALGINSAARVDGRPSDPIAEEPSSSAPAGSAASAHPGPEVGISDAATSAFIAPSDPVLNQAYAPPLFEHYIRPPQERIPHLGHVALLGLLAVSGLAIVAILAEIAVMRHLFGVTSLADATSNVRYLLGTQALLYLFTFAGSLIVFPLVWHKGLFAGLQWHGRRALQNSGVLIAAAGICFILAMIDGYFFPGPKDAPIDRIFRLPGAAWILFAFGVTFAPFFEEIAFRGFLLPALATAGDWIGEKIAHNPRRSLDLNGHPQWSFSAMAIASLLTSIVFAFMHADQTSYSLGPFVLLIVVSLVLCFARLRLRSLASSVLLHASYNFLLFSFMLIGTSGFRHLDKM
jgi:uncharacterized protein